MAKQDLEPVMAGTTVGHHLNTKFFLVAFQLCIWDECNKVGNNRIDKTDIPVVRRTSYASSITRTLYLCIQLIVVTLQKLFFFSCSFEKSLNSYSLML